MNLMEGKLALRWRLLLLRYDDTILLFCDYDLGGGADDFYEIRWDAWAGL